MSNPNLVSVKNLILLIRHHFTDQPTNYPKQDTETGIVSLDYDLDKFYKALMPFKNNFDVKQIEEIIYKGQKFPIYEIEINKGARKKLFILSGTHGNEHAGMLTVIELLKDVKTNPNFYKDIHILILVPHNPVGAKYFSRYNGDGIDLNRDFKKRRTVETRTVINSMKLFKQDYTLSLHEAPQEKGTFVYCNKLVDKKLAMEILEYAKRQGVKLAFKNYFNFKLKTPGYFPLTGLSYFLIKLWSDVLNLQPEGYYTRLKDIPNITIETPWRSKDKSLRISSQLLITKGFVKAISQV